MAASTALTDLVFDTGTATASPLIACLSYVYVASEYDGPNDSYEYNPYQVIEIVLRTSSTGAYLDSAGDPADSDGALDWNINNADNSAPDTSTLFPFFYKLMNVSSTKTSVVHESLLKTLTGIKLVIAAEVAASWTNPS
jgi:hypothetical protein